MAGIAVLQTQAELDGWMAASAAVKAGQRYKIGGLELGCTDAKLILYSIVFKN